MMRIPLRLISFHGGGRLPGHRVCGMNTGVVSSELTGAAGALIALVLLGLFFGQLIVSTPAQIPLIFSLAVPLFLLAFFRMDLALVFLIFAMLLSPEVVLGTLPKRNIAIRLEDLLIVVMGIAWIARAAVFKHIEIIPRTALNRWVGIYCVCFLISTLQGMIISGVNPVKAMFYVFKYLEYFILYYIVAGTTFRRKQYQVFLVAFFLTLVIVDCYAISQIGHVQRVVAPFEVGKSEPNTLGGYLVLMMSLSLGFFCQLRSRKMRWFMGGIAALTFVPFLYTLSRSSYMALVPAFLSLIIFGRFRGRRVLFGILVCALFGAVFLLPDGVKQRVLYTFNAPVQQGIAPLQFFGLQMDPSASSRWQDWMEAFSFWRRAPFFGYGLTGHSFIDSQFVSNLVELGAIGFIAFAILIGTVHAQALRIYRQSKDDIVQGLALGFVAGNIGMVVHALTSNTFILIRVMEPYWFLAALVMVSFRLEAERDDPLQKTRDFAQSGRNIHRLLRGNEHGKPLQGDLDAT